jgi:acyl-CoA synthetase (AMP-forming)/AMP-acid ligase II
VTGGTTAHVLGIPDPDRGQLVAAVVVHDDGDDDLDETTLREQLKTQLSSYKIPHRIVALPAARVPVLSSGKVDLGRLATVFDA